MTTLNLEWDSKQLKYFTDRRIQKAVLAALTKAGSGAIKALKAASTKRMRERKRFKAAKVNRGQVIGYPRGVKDIDALQWRLDISSDPVPVSDFPVRQTKKGVSVEINRGKRVLIRSAFIATLKNGHRGVFTRRGRDRLPIDQAFSTRLSDVIQDNGAVEQVFARAGEVFNRDFARLLPLEIEKLGV